MAARRILAALLLTLLPLRAALGGPRTVRLWHAYRGEERVALQQLLDRYEALHPDVVVAALAVPYESYYPKLESAIPRGNGPDVFIAAHERLGTWTRAGLVRPVGLSGEAFHPIAVAALTVDGRTWGVPLAAKSLALFVRTDLVERPPRTTEEMVRAARRLAGEGRHGMAWEATAPYFHAPWMHGFGGGVFRDGRLAIDRPANAASLAWLQGLQQEGLLPEEPTAALVTRLFNEGGAAMVVNGPWFLGEIDPGVPFAVAPLPVVSETGLPAAPYLGVEAAMVAAPAREPEAALALARWLAEPEQALHRALHGRQVVVTRAALDDPRVAGDPVLAAFAAQLDTAVPMPVQPAMVATWEPLARALRRVLRGALPPDRALRAAAHEVEVVLRPPPPPARAGPYLAALAALVLLAGWRLGRRMADPALRAGIRARAHAYLWVAPAALAMLVLVVAPFAVGAAVSLFAHHQGRFTFVGLANFLDILLARDWPVTSPLSFWSTLAVTVLWTVANVALHVGIGLALALLLRERWLRLRGLYRVLLIVPWSVPSYITALTWKGMFHRQFGAINGLLAALGQEPVSWFGRFSTAFAANLATNTWLGFPFMMVVTLGALQTIPRDLEDAAEVDGATGWQRFRHVTLPLLAPALLPAVVLGSVWTFNMFNVIYLVSGGEPDGATEILISDAYRWAFTRNQRYGYAAAYAVLIFGVLLAWTRIAARVRGGRSR